VLTYSKWIIISLVVISVLNVLLVVLNFIYKRKRYISQPLPH
jgi:hypothetical protein